VYLGAQFVSFSGTWTQVVALGWLTLEATRSPLAVAAVTAAETLPSLVLSPFAGSFADRFSKRRIMVFTQLASFAVALGFAFAAFNAAKFPVFLLLATTAGVIGAIDGPVRQALLYELVGRERVADTSALNSLTFNVARVVAGPLAGILLAWQGAALCFLFNACSYLFVLGAVLAIREPGAEPEPGARAGRADRAGIARLLADRKLRRLFISFSIFNVFALNHAQLLPSVVLFRLHGNSELLGYVVGTLGAGALVSSVCLMWMDRTSPRLLLGSSIALTALVFVLGVVNTPAATYVTVFFLGAAIVQLMVRMSSLIQSLVDSRSRGAATGLVSLCVIGLTPLGAMQSGLLAQYLGVGAALMLGAIMTVPALLYLLSALRPGDDAAQVLALTASPEKV